MTQLQHTDHGGWMQWVAPPTGSLPPRAAVFLDRDGVLNPLIYDADHGLFDSPLRPDQLTLAPGAASAVRLLNGSGLLAVVVSNQPGVAKGKLSRTMLAAVTDALIEALAREDAYLDGIYYCLHHPEADDTSLRACCPCRKPEPGLLLQAGGDLEIVLDDSCMVGDGLTDIAAGRRAGCDVTVWIGRQKCESCTTMEAYGAFPDVTVGNVLDAVRAIGRRRNRHAGLR